MTMAPATLRGKSITELLNCGRLGQKTIAWLKLYGFAVVYDERGQAVNLREMSEEEMLKTEEIEVKQHGGTMESDV